MDESTQSRSHFEGGFFVAKTGGEVLSDVKLIQGDCLEKMKEIEDSSIDLTVTSPPYDNLRTYNGNNDNWNEEVWKRVIAELFRVTKDGGVVVWVVGDATIKGCETGTSFRQALYFMDIGWRLHDTMIWSKPNPIPRTHRRYEQAFEYMFILSKGSPKTWNPVMIPCRNAGKRRNMGTIQQGKDGVRTPRHTGGYILAEKQSSNVWVHVPRSTTSHPAEYPTSLAHDHILSWSNPVDLVLDPFMGSGTTGVACVNTDRNFIGIELNETYFKIAEKRVRETHPPLFYS